MGGLATEQVIDLSAYGKMGFGETAVAQSITQNQWTVVTNVTNDLWATSANKLKGVSYLNDTLVINKAGFYDVDAQLSVDGSASSILRLGLYVNDVLVCVCTGYQQLANNKIIQMTYVDLLELEGNDVIKVVITNTANSNGVDAIAGKIVIRRVG